MAVTRPGVSGTLEHHHELDGTDGTGREGGENNDRRINHHKQFLRTTRMTQESKDLLVTPGINGRIHLPARTKLAVGSEHPIQSMPEFGFGEMFQHTVNQESPNFFALQHTVLICILTGPSLRACLVWAQQSNQGSDMQ